MASQILSNHLAPGGGKVVVLYKPGSTSVVNLALSGFAATGETVSEVAISRIFYTGSGQMKIARNTTSVFVSGDTDDSFDFDFKAAGCLLSANSDQAVNVTFADANSTAIIEFQKTSNYSTTTY